ncbi:HNH endonuclease [Pseudomonas protegens]|uniref:HNH endonuclease n=1 Tax=Pseudomonas protegens TaxID=380021 RepID=UPI0038012007
MKTHKPPKGKTHTLYKPKDRVVSLKSAAWQRLRAQVLAEQPLCEHCYDDGKVTPATDVDHIDNNGDNNARDNLASLCHSCHSIKTHAEMHGRKRRKAWGCDVNGFPLDPDHHWNRGAKDHQQPAQQDRPLSLTHKAAAREFPE